MIQIIAIFTSWFSYSLLQGWTKGVVFLNGINLGRYYNEGPQETLFVPGPWLNKGDNTVLIFELYEAPRPLQMESISDPKFTGTVSFQI